MQQYIDCLKHILENGVDSDNRTGIGTKSVFGYQMRFNLQDGFPAVTTKKLAWRAVVGELLWFLEGSTDERRLAELTHKSKYGTVTIWSANAEAAYWKPKAKFEGDLGNVYGYQWRNWEKYKEIDTDADGVIRATKTRIDQVTDLINAIKNDPYSRRHLLTAWNVSDLDKMALPPCHFVAQFYVRNNTLSCMMTQRSCDVGLGMNFNHASYALLMHIIARECGLQVGEFIHSIGDAHIYNDHIEGVQEIITRKPYPPPTLKIDESFDLMDRLQNGFRIGDVDLFRLENYQHHPTVKMKMAV